MKVAHSLLIFAAAISCASAFQVSLTAPTLRALQPASSCRPRSGRAMTVKMQYDDQEPEKKDKRQLMMEAVMEKQR
jgi:hypothetical protein